MLPIRKYGERFDKSHGKCQGPLIPALPKVRTRFYLRRYKIFLLP
jgi:hypothetical protein